VFFHVVDVVFVFVFLGFFVPKYLARVSQAKNPAALLAKSLQTLLAYPALGSKPDVSYYYT